MAQFGFCARLQSSIGWMLSIVSLVTSRWLQRSLLHQEEVSEKHPDLMGVANAQEEEQAANNTTETCTSLMPAMEIDDEEHQEPEIVDTAETQEVGLTGFKYPETHPAPTAIAEPKKSSARIEAVSTSVCRPSFADMLRKPPAQNPGSARNPGGPGGESRAAPTAIVEPKQASTKIGTVTASTCSPSFADMLKTPQARILGSERNPEGGCLPPSHGYRFAALPAAGTQRRRRASCLSDSKPTGAEGDDAHDSTAVVASHGWSKQHKASRNAKLQRKVDWSKQRRAEQSRASQFCEEDD